MTTNPKCRAAGGSCNCSNADAVSCPDQHATAPAMTTMTEHFEAWALANGFKIERREDAESPDTYFRYETEQRWIVWQAATATIQPVAAPEPVPHDWNEKLLNFIDSVVEVAFEGGDLDGGTIQEWAETAGLLEARTMTEPCSEGQNCRCADGNDFPLTCYQKTYRRAAAPAQAAPDEVTVAWFRQASSFGPWVECKPTDEGATRFNRTVLRTTSTNKGEAA